MRRLRPMAIRVAALALTFVSGRVFFVFGQLVGTQGHYFARRSLLVWLE